MRSSHLTSEETAAYGERKLAPELALEISDHLAVCVECRDQLRQAERQRNSIATATVNYEELTAYLDNELDVIERREISEKLERSPQARRELRDLVELKQEMALADAGSGEGFRKWLLPLAAGLVIAAGAGWWLTTNKTRDVAGELSPELRATLDQTLAQGRFAFPPLVEQLRSSRGQLASQASARNTALKLISPVGTAIATQTPVLRWTKVADATGYRVHVAARNSDAISTFDIAGSETTSMASQPLTDGQTYQWEVQAIRDGEAIEQAPVAPEPEALFYVLSRAQRDDLAKKRAKLGGSHLALGLVYAGAGLIDDAKEEFRAFGQANPKSDLPRKLREALEK